MQGKRLERVNQLIKEEISAVLQRQIKDPRLGFVTVTEVDTTGKVYWEVMVNSPGYATRLPGGNTLVASIEGKFVAEYDRTGKEVWRQNTPGRPFRVHRR